MLGFYQIKIHLKLDYLITKLLNYKTLVAHFRNMKKEMRGLDEITKLKVSKR